MSLEKKPLYGGSLELKNPKTGKKDLWIGDESSGCFSSELKEGQKVDIFKDKEFEEGINAGVAEKAI